MKRLNEPQPDPEAFCHWEDLEHKLNQGHEYTSRLLMIVHRKKDGSRTVVERCQLDVNRGVIGDRWEFSRNRKRGEQIAVMDHSVADKIANGQPLTLFGDNLFVDCNFSEPNFQVGSRYRLGEAVLEVSAVPHEGCSKFRKRFGLAALKFISSPLNKKLRLRGIYLSVLESGEIKVGDVLQQI